NQDAVYNAAKKTLSCLNTLALAFVTLPSSPPGSTSTHTDICQFNGFGVEPKGLHIAQERCYRQLAPTANPNIVYALGTASEIYRIELRKQAGAEVTKVSLKDMQLNDVDGRTMKATPDFFAELHGIAYDSKRNRVLFSAFSGSKERLISFVPGGNRLQLVTV